MNKAIRNQHYRRIQRLIMLSMKAELRKLAKEKKELLPLVHADIESRRVSVIDASAKATAAIEKLFKKD